MKTTIIEAYMYLMNKYKNNYQKNNKNTLNNIDSIINYWKYGILGN